MNKIGEFMLASSIFSITLAIIFWFGYLKIDRYNQNVEIVSYINNTNNKHSNNKYYGYIKFPRYNLERLIKKGNPNKVIEEGYIGIYSYNEEENFIDPLILVGHSRENLFSVLHKISENDLIEIIIRNNIYRYKVVKIKIIDVDDYQSLNNLVSNQIGLITCLEDNSKRLLVIGNMI